MKTFFELLLEELTAEYDRLLTAACAGSREVEYKTLFDGWIEWTKYLGIDVSSRTTPAWIPLKTYPEALDWCAATNPDIVPPGTRLNNHLQSLQSAGKIAAPLPKDLLLIMPEEICEIIVELEDRGDKASADKVKQEYSSLIASDAKKTEGFAKLKASMAAKNVALRYYEKNKGKFADFDDRGRLEASLSKARNSEDVVESFLAFFSTNRSKYSKFKDSWSHKILSIFLAYYKIKGEHSDATDSLKNIKTIAYTRNDSKFIAAQEWANIILKLKDTSELVSCFESSIANNVCYSEHKIVNPLLFDKNGQTIEMIRTFCRTDLQEITKARSITEFLSKLSASAYSMGNNEPVQFLSALQMFIHFLNMPNLHF